MLVLPGMLGTDLSTVPLRRFLTRLGYPVTGWRAGGDVRVATALAKFMAPALHRLTEQHGQPASVIGWCVGGLYARHLAASFPDEVRQVITLGTPFRLSPATHDLRMPSTAFYSTSEGMVPWRACREQTGARRDSVGVPSSHLGFGHHPLVLWAVADRLAQQRGRWLPFDPPRALRRLYTSEERAGRTRPPTEPARAA
ncbi:MAG: esterase/lipase family protein [Actinomycetes bacterium]